MLVATLSALTSVAVLVSGCSVLGLSSEDPVDASIVTSAAPVASGGSTSRAVVTIPTLGTGSSSTQATPTPWEDLTSSSAPPSTSEPPLTAPTTTRTTLTFSSFSTATKPTVAAPSLSATPPPRCYTEGSCAALDSDSAGSGTVLVVNPPGGDASVAILTVGGKAVDALSLARLGSPSVDCAGSHCLVQGTNSGVHFGGLVAVNGRRLTAVPGSPVSAGSLRLVGSGSGLLVAGTQMFADYGLPVTDAPVAARTWVLSGGRLSSTGCSAPRLYARPPSVDSAQHGTCSGTPKIAGYGAASAHPIRHLGGFSTPSGNIACAVVPGDKLACTAKQHDFSVTKCSKPEKEVPEGLRGLRVLVGTSGGVFHDGCLGYTLIGSPDSAISYGRLAAGDGFVCEVQESGVTCTAPSGHGFTLSRSALKTH